MCVYVCLFTRVFTCVCLHMRLYLCAWTFVSVVHTMCVFVWHVYGWWPQGSELLVVLLVPVMWVNYLPGLPQLSYEEMTSSMGSSATYCFSLFTSLSLSPIPLPLSVSYLSYLSFNSLFIIYLHLFSSLSLPFCLSDKHAGQSCTIIWYRKTLPTLCLVIEVMLKRCCTILYSHRHSMISLLIFSKQTLPWPPNPITTTADHLPTLWCVCVCVCVLYTLNTHKLELYNIYRHGNESEGK